MQAEADALAPFSSFFNAALAAEQVRY